MENIKKLTSVLFFSIVCLFFSTTTSFSQQSIGKLYEKALYTEEVKGELPQAIDLYQQILKSNPENRQIAAKALLHLGICHEKMGLKEAQGMYNDVITKYSEQIDEVALAREKLMHLEAYVADINRKAEQHLKKGNELFSRWEYESAIEEYNKAIELDPNTLLAQNAGYCIGQSWFRAGKYDIALAAFKKLIEENPESNIAPVTELMIEQVEHVLKNNNPQVMPEMNADENTIVDPETGITYRKIKTFTGNNDLISYTTGGFNMMPDGRFLVLENKVVPTDGSDPFDLVNMDAQRAVYSPDMKNAAFYADSAIWIVPVSPETGQANGPPKKLLDGGYRFQSIMSWSPDGGKIAFSRYDESNRGSIWTISISDGKLMPITNSLGIKRTPAWSPDGRSIAYEDDGIWIAPTNGNESKLISKNGGNPHWSTDGKWLFLTKSEGHFYSLDNKNSYKFNFPKQVGSFGTFSSSGDKLLFYKSSFDGIWGIKVVSILGGPSFTPARTDAVYGSTWSPDGKFLLAQSANEDGNIIYKIVPMTGEKSVVVNIKTDLSGDPFPFSTSNDMTQLAFVIKREDGNQDLYIAPFSIEDACTTGPARLVFEGWKGGAFNVTFSWSNDGTKLALIHKGDIWIIPLEDGSPLQITNTPMDRRIVRWSPDGKMISYHIPTKQTGIMYTIPASGGNPKEVTKVENGTTTWSPNSKSITMISNNKLILVSIDGEKIKSIGIPKEFGANQYIELKYSPDGKHLAWINYNDDDSYIFYYSFEDDKFTQLVPKVLDDLKYGLVWSPDGKWISYLTYEEEKIRPEGVLWEADFEEVKGKLLK